MGDDVALSLSYVWCDMELKDLYCGQIFAFTFYMDMDLIWVTTYSKSLSCDVFLQLQYVKNYENVPQGDNMVYYRSTMYG